MTAKCFPEEAGSEFCLCLPSALTGAPTVRDMTWKCDGGGGGLTGKSNKLSILKDYTHLLSELGHFLCV